jgi:hypothetical protein
MSEEATNWSTWSDKMRELTTQELIDRLTKERDEAEQRGYCRGIKDAARTIVVLVENPVEQKCCGFGQGSPPECCANPINLIDGCRAYDDIIALQEQSK